MQATKRILDHSYSDEAWSPDTYLDDEAKTILRDGRCKSLRDGGPHNPIVKNGQRHCARCSKPLPVSGEG